MLCRTEFSRKTCHQDKLLTDREINSIFCELNRKGIGSSVHTLRLILDSDFVPEIDPFRSYFDSLPAWKPGMPDYITELAETIKAENQDFWITSFKKWLVAVVASAIDPMTVNHQVLVLIGSQGIGKTTWLHRLLPKSLLGYQFTGTVYPNNKDSLVQLSENLFIHLDEFENLTRSEIGSIKSLITNPNLTLRRPFGHFNERYIHRASFTGSVNENEFLNDLTGNRRFLSIRCLDINYQYTLDIDNAYSQAFALYKSGEFKYWWDASDIQALEEINSEHVKVPIEEELFLKTYAPATGNSDSVLLMTPADIAISLNKKYGVNFTTQRSLQIIGRIAKKNGFEKCSKGNSKPYRVVEIA